MKTQDHLSVPDRQPRAELRYEDLHDFWQRCPICEGSGVMQDPERLCNVQCPDCDGEGFTEI